MHPKYLLLTDFEIVRCSLKIGLTPLQFRIVQYISCCKANDILVEMSQTADWIGISQQKLDRELKAIALNPRYGELERFVAH